jgi:hypothetical protein
MSPSDASMSQVHRDGKTARVLDRLDSLLARRDVGFLLLIALGALYLIDYFGDPALPGKLTAGGWWDWFDQGQYWKSARALSELSISREDYWYPLGYPLLGAPFMRSFPMHAFLVPNLLLSLGSAAIFFRICRLFLRPWEALLVTSCVLVLLERELSLSMVHPWNTIPTTFLAYLLIFLYLRREADGRLVLVLSALAAMIFLCRPVDAVAHAPILVAAVLGLRGLKRKALFGFVGAGLILLVFLGIRMVNLHVYGTWSSRYERDQSFMGLFSYDIPQKLYSIIIDGFPIYQTTDPMLLVSQPWLLLALPGLIYACFENRRVIPVLAAISLSVFVYVNYNAMRSDALYGTSLIHYFVWTSPPLALFSYLTIRHAWRIFSWPVFAALAIGPLLLLGSIRLKAVDQEPACVSSEGRVVATATRGEGEAEGRSFDVALVEDRNPDADVTLEIDGQKLWVFRDFTRSSLRGQNRVALYFARGVDPSREELRLAEPRGTRALFYRLEWELGWGRSGLWSAIGRRFGGRGTASDRNAEGPETPVFELSGCDPIPVPEPSAGLGSASAGLMLALLALRRRRANQAATRISRSHRACSERCSSRRRVICSGAACRTG